MSDGELKYPEWQVLLQDLMQEFDRERLRKKIQKVEALIFERLQQLRQESDGRGELKAIDDAVALLRIVKRDKLDFPDWR
jgi:hypothetical protein